MRLTNGELSVSVMEVLNTVQGVAALAEKLPQVSVDFAGDPIAENEIQTIISEMDRARLQWTEENIEDLCPKCGAKVSVTRTKRWLILDKVSYRCVSCGFATDSQENYDMLVAERVANTKGIAVSKFLGLAGTTLDSSSKCNTLLQVRYCDGNDVQPFEQRRARSDHDRTAARPQFAGDRWVAGT